MKILQRYLVWLTATAVLTLVFGTMYATLQLTIRQDANDPQIQMAEDSAASLDQGASPYSLTSLGVDMAHSLAPFIIVYDHQGHIVTGTGYLNGTIPAAPLGMLQHSVGTTYHAITWQPAHTVRIASVTVASKKYFVLSGRSLTEVEKRETDTLQMTALGWFASIAVVTLALRLRQRAK